MKNLHEKIQAPSDRFDSIELEDFVVEDFRDYFQDSVVDLILDIQQHEFGLPLSIEDQPDLLDINQKYKVFLVARVGECVIGTVGLMDIGDGIGVIRKLFVDLEYRGKEKGVSACLLRTLLGKAMDNGIKQIYLGTTEAFKAAHRFYERAGFDEVEVSDLPELFPRMEIDSKFFKLDIVSSI